MNTLWYRIVCTVAGVALVALYGSELVNNMANLDMWGYLSFGLLYWKNDTFPLHDIFAYAPVKELWVYHEWLTGVVYYPLYERFGLEAIQMLRFGVAGTTALVLFLGARRRGASVWFALLGLSLALVPFGEGFAFARAQIFTNLFVAVFLYALDRARYGSWWWLAPLPVCMLAWGNLHGGFLAGLGIMGVFGAGVVLERGPWLRFAVATVVCAAIMCINPYGMAYWTYLLDAVSMHREQIAEWHSLAVSLRKGMNVFPYLWFVGLVITTAVCWLWCWWQRLGVFGHQSDQNNAHARQWWQVEWSVLLVLAVTAYMGGKHYRHTVFFGFACAMYAPVLLQWCGERFADVLGKVGRYLRMAGMVAVAAVLLVLAVPKAQPLARAVQQGQLFYSGAPGVEHVKPGQIFYPIGAVEALRVNNVQGNLLPTFAWGEFIYWNLFPNIRVGMDGRYETIYDDQYCLDYFNFMQARPGWQQFLEQHPHQMILLVLDTPVVPYLVKSPGWTVAYRDKGSILFVRSAK